MAELIKLSQLRAVLVQLDREHRLAMHQMNDDGAGIINMPALQISLRVVPDDGINAIVRTQTNEAEAQETLTVMPEVKRIASTQSKSERAAEEAGKREAADKSTETGTSTDVSSENATDTATSEESTNDLSTTTQTNQHGTTNTQDTSVNV